MNMLHKKVRYVSGLIMLGIILTLWISCSQGKRLDGLRIACNDDAAGLLIGYIAQKAKKEITTVDMSYQQLQDCCNSQTELALSTGNFDMALLCPDAAEKLLEGGQPYFVMGAVVYNANVMVTREPSSPKTIGYMNLREIQKDMVVKNYGAEIELKPMMPTALPYALERKAIDGAVLDILSALKIGGCRSPLLYDRPTAVLVAHKSLIGTAELSNFITLYNTAVGELNQEDFLKEALTSYLQVEDSKDEVAVWKNMQIHYQKIAD